MAGPCYVDVTAGERQLVSAVVTETTGAVLDLSELALALVPDGAEPGSWLPPDESAVLAVNSIRVKLLVDTRFPPGTYRMYVRVTDYPEVLMVPVVHGRVVVA